MRAALVILIAAALASSAPPAPLGPQAARAETLQAQRLSPEERRLILETMATAGLDRSTLDDEALVASLIAFARQELGLRVRPISIDRFWAIEPPQRRPEAEFQEARANGTIAAWLAGLSPKHEQYLALRAFADRYRAAALSPFTPLSLPLLRAGDSHADLALLRERLAAEGFPAQAGEDPLQFDAGLDAAVRTFQRERGLAVDGVVGRATLAALNVPPAARAEQIEANLERVRWLPRELPADRLEVNIAAAEAALIQKGAETLRMRIVVGAAATRTPMFASRIESIVFNPPWNVPDSIARNEILPRAARDPGYLARNGYSYVGGRLQQRPGPGNSLGRIKFDLPSPFGVYLHDTPSKGAFQQATRTLSHGCMRLEKPEALALALLEPQGWTAAQITAAIDAGATRRVGLERPLPLYVFYQTAIAEEGRLRLVPDHYGWDARLNAALRGARTIAAAPSAGTDCADPA